jgi:hypothetical protein
MKTLTRCAFVTAGLLAFAVPASAGDLKLTIANGRVTLMARDVTVRQILDEWSRIGQTRIVNGEKLAGPPITLELVDVPEAKALDSVLRSASGYVLVARAAAAGPSVYDRILILATSRPPAASAVPPPAFNRPMPQQPPPVPVVDDEDEGREPILPPGVAPPAGAQPYPGPPMPQPGQPPVTNQPGQIPNQQPQAPMTAPRPGQLPTPPPIPGNPYQPPAPTRPPGGGGPGGQ